MDFGRLQQLLAGMPGRGNPAMDSPMPDTAEKIQISSLSLLKMLKHGKYSVLTHLFPDYPHCLRIGRAGVPMEVMGLMLGQFVDDYTITCVDVFAMPQVNPVLLVFFDVITPFFLL
jgi:26S proteasome regulatory subunit N11